MPVNTIALACAAVRVRTIWTRRCSWTLLSGAHQIEVSLYEWKDGIFSGTDFAAGGYRKRWEYYIDQWDRLASRDSTSKEYTSLTRQTLYVGAA